MDASQCEVAELKVFCLKILKYILNNSASKNSIKKADIVKHCLNGNSKVFPRVFKSACEQLADVNYSVGIPCTTLFTLSFQIYGLSLNETPKTSTKSYICTTSFRALSKRNYVPLKYRCDWNLLSIVLSYIFMRGGSITDRKYFVYFELFFLILINHNWNRCVV